MRRNDRALSEVRVFVSIGTSIQSSAKLVNASPTRSAVQPRCGGGLFRDKEPYHTRCNAGRSGVAGGGCQQVGTPLNR
jgi:hypothetical protein